MILFVNTSKKNELDVFLISEKKVIDKIIFKGDFKVSENLLKQIDKLLNKNKLTFKSIKGIINIIGPGPFTSIRISVAVTNTLAYSLKIPVVGLKNINNKTAKELIELGLEKLSKTKKGKYIKPFYNKEPNITKPKK